MHNNKTSDHISGRIIMPHDFKTFEGKNTFEVDAIQSSNWSNNSKTFNYIKCHVVDIKPFFAKWVKPFHSWQDKPGGGKTT